MRMIITLVLFAMMLSFAKMEENKRACLQMDIMLLGDFSDSVNGHESFIIDAFREFTNKFDLADDGIKIGAIAFGSDVKLVSPLTSDRTELTNGIDILVGNSPTGNTNLKDALILAYDQLIKNGRDDYRKMIIIISDGEPDYPNETLTIAYQIKGANIGICTVLILGDRISPETLRQLSSNDCYVETRYEELISEIKKLNVCV